MIAVHSKQFRIPWTGQSTLGREDRRTQKFYNPLDGGNPKLHSISNGAVNQFRIPWTGGNPKQTVLGNLPFRPLLL